MTHDDHYHLNDTNSAAQADALQVDQAKLLFASLPTAIIANALLALILIAVQSTVIPQAQLLGWLVMISTILLARAGLALIWRRRSTTDVNDVSSWIRYFRLGVIVTGIVWGLAVLFLFPVGDKLHQLFLAFVLAGLSAGAITTLAVDRVSTIGFLLPTLIPLIVRFVMEGDTVSFAMGGMVVIFLAAIMINAERAGRTLRENLLLRIKAAEKEQVLRQSEARLNQAQRSAHIGYWELDINSNKLSWSDEVYRIFEVDRAIFGECYKAFLNLIDPEDRDKVNKAYTDSLTKRKPYDITHRLHFADGRIKYVHERCETEFDDSGKAIRSLGTIQDITAIQLTEIKLLETEKHFRLLFETSRDALMTSSSPTWKFTAANRATLQLFGVASEAEFTDLRPWDISPERQPDGRYSSEKAQQMIEIALQQGSNFFEWTHKRLDGTTFPTEVLLSRLEQDGQINLQASVRDITERKHLQQEIREQRNEMETLQKSQVAAQTAAAIAHELNQPLLAVASYSEAALLLLNAENPNMNKIRDAIKAGERQALRAGQSIRHLLDYLSMKEFPREPFDLNKNIIRMIDLLRSEHALQLRCVYHMEEQLPMVWVNRTHAQKVLSNLLCNSIEAMQEANIPLPTITVTTRTIKDEGIAQVSIQDNGPGINKDDIPRLFKPFITTKTNGIGMGLAISRSLIELNDGQLWVDPQAGPGVTFHFTLPFAT